MLAEWILIIGINNHGLIKINMKDYTNCVTTLHQLDIEYKEYRLYCLNSKTGYIVFEGE